MRVISGSCRRKPLKSVPGMDTRPTSDRLRESIFNILGSSVKNAVVLDLFAGTGALGIEALSRGAAASTFIDTAPSAIRVIRENIESCGFSACSRVRKWDICRNLSCIKDQSPPFTLVFMDPPYGRGMIRSALGHLRDAGCLSPGALCVIEHTEAEPDWGEIPDFFPEDRRKYGKTLVSFALFSI